jgi:hypothetical protein
VSAKVEAWPNGLGFDVGPNEVWRWRKVETMVRLFRAEDPRRISHAGSPAPSSPSRP